MLRKTFLSLLFLCVACMATLRAQVSVDSLKSGLNKPLAFNCRQLIGPSLCIASGIVLQVSAKEQVRDWRNQHLPDFHTKIDNALPFAPIAAVYILDLAGLKAKNDFLNRSAILCKGELVMLGTVYLLKGLTKETRPDGSDNSSFPSSHTAQAFLAASFLSQEYKDQIPWMPYAAYTLAASVGALRIANNQHYIGDVLVGAGIGILSQKLSYWTHQYRWGRNVPKPILKF